MDPLCDCRRSGGHNVLCELPLPLSGLPLQVADSDPTARFPARLFKYAPLGTNTNYQVREDRTSSQAGARARASLQGLTPAALIAPGQNIAQAARLREEVERASRRLQQSNESMETYLQTSIQTMGLLLTYIAQSQGADGARSAVLLTLSGYIDLTMQNLTATRQKH